MTQGIRTDRAPMPAAQDETQTDDALNAAVVRLLTRTEAKGRAEIAGPAFAVPRTHLEKPAGPGARIEGIDATLHYAVEAHRDEIQRQMREGAETDGEEDADMNRLVALADVIRATPTPTLADLRHKVIYLWSGKWPDSKFSVGELRSSLDSIRQDIMKLADADAIARTDSRPDPFADPNRHEGFVPMPAYKPTCFMDIALAIPLEAQRLLDVAQAQFERRVPAYAGFPPDERDAHIARMRSEYRLDQLEVLTWAEPDDEPVAPPLQADGSINRVIEAHRRAYASFDVATRDADEVAVARDGGDTSVEATAASRKAWQAAHEAEETAFEAVLALRPSAPAGLAAMLRYIAETPAFGELDSPSTAAKQMAEAAEAVAVNARGAKVSQAEVRKISGPARRDPVFTIIEEHRAAYAAWAAEPEEGPAFVDPAGSPADIAGSRERAVFSALMTARPTTLAGVMALAEYLPGAIRQVAIDEEGEGERALRNLAVVLRELVPAADELPSSDPVRAAIDAERLATDPAHAGAVIHGTLNASEPLTSGSPTLPVCAPDFSSMTLGEIEALFDMCDTAQRFFIALSYLPGGKGEAGRFRVVRSHAARESNRLYEIMSACADAARGCIPTDEMERTFRTAVLVRSAVETAAWSEVAGYATAEASALKGGRL